MKHKKSNRFLAVVLTSMVTLSSSAFAVDRIKQNNTTALNLAGSWDTLPTASDVGVFETTYATTGVLDTGALVQWSGVRVASPGGNVIVNNATAGQNLGVGAAGVDLSAAAVNLSIQRFQMDAGQTWNVASGKNFTIGNSTSARTGVFVNSSAASTITKTGAGAAILDTGNNSLGNVNWNIQGGVVRAIWNQANALGSGTITLGGGGIAPGTPFGGSVGNWTWNNAITLTAATSSFIDNQNIAGSARWLKLDGIISGSGNLEFRDTGTGFDDANYGFILSSTNLNTGTVTIGTGAEVRVGGEAPGIMNGNTGNNGKLAADSALVANNGTLTFSRLDAHTVANNISGTGTVRIGTSAVIGTSTASQNVTLSGTNTYIGDTTVNNGRLNLTGSLTSAINVTGTSKVSGSGSTTGLLTTAAGTGIVLAGGATTTSLTANGVTFSGATLVTFDSAPIASTVYDVVSYGAGGVTNLGNLTGGVRGTVSDVPGVKVIFTAGAYGATRTWNTTTGTWAINTGTNFVEGDQKYFDGDQVIFGEIASDSVITLTGALAPGSVNVTNAANIYTFQTGSLTGSASLAKSGAGSLKLTGANTYTGDTTITAGSIILTHASALGSSGTITLNSPTTGASNTSLLVDASGGSLTFARPLTVANEGSGTTTMGSSALTSGAQVLWTGAIALNKDVSLVGVSGGDRTQFSGGISGTGNLEVSGTGRVLFLGTANTYAGNTEVNGILQLSDGSVTATSFIPDASNVTINATKSLKLAKGGNSETIGGLFGAGSVEAISGTDTLIVGGGDAAGSFPGVLKNNGGTLQLTKIGAGIQTLSGINTHTGTTRISAGTLELSGSAAIADTGVVTLDNIAGATLKLDSSESIGSLSGGGATGGNVDLQANTLTLGNGATFSGNINGAGNIVKNGGSNLVLNGNNTFTGSTTVNSGYLVFDSLAAEDGAGALVLNGGNLAIGAVFAGDAATIGSLSGNSATSSINPNFGATNGIKTLAVNQTVDGVYDGKIEGNSGRVIALTKSGSAKLTLTGTNTYNGATTVTGGTLAVTGTLGATAITVQTGATLGGNGNLGGSVTIESGGHHALAVAATNGTQVTRTITGALDLTAVGDILDLTAAAPPAAGVYVLATASDGITGAPETVNQSGVTGTFAVNGNNLELTVGGSDFDTWIGTFTFAAGADLTATGDPDGDGLTNQEEYAFGLKPNDGSSVNPIKVQLNKTAGTFTYTRRDDALQVPTPLIYKVWTSTDLSGWTEDTLATQDDSAGPVVGGVEPVVVTLSATIPLTAPKLFVRVTAE